MLSFVLPFERQVFVAHCLVVVIVVIDINHCAACALVLDDYVLVVVVYVVLGIVGYFGYGRRRCGEALTFGFVCSCYGVLLFVRRIVKVVKVNVFFGFVKL